MSSLPAALAGNRRPAFSGPPHAVFPGGGAAIWFTRPTGFIVQLLQPTHGTADLARFITDEGTDRLLTLARPGEKLIFVHDLSPLTGYDSEARRILTEKGMSIRDRVDRLIVVPPPETRKIVQMGLAAASASLSLLGIRMSMEPSLMTVIAKLGLVRRDDV